MENSGKRKRIVPFAVYYDKAEFCFDWARFLSYVITIAAVLISIAERIFQLEENLSNRLSTLNTVMIISYLILSYRGSYLFRLAETKRKSSFIDNTFNTKFSESDTQQYYTNDNIPNGIYKLAVNNLESCFTTDKNLSFMFNRILVKNVVSILLIVFAGVFGAGSYARIATESILISSFTLELFQISVYSSRVDELLKDFYYLFQTLNPDNITNLQTAQIMKQLLEYETTVAWANFPLDDNNFTKNRGAWDAEWKNIKIRYNIP